MMKTVILCGLIGALFTVPSPAARKKDRPWPPFQVGVTGVMAAPANATVIPLTVAEVTPDTPAAGKLQVGDVLVAVNGVKPFTYSAEGFERMVPLVVEVLKNPRSDISEIDAALFAMGAAPKKCIVEHLGLIASFLKHDEWWLRSSAFMAVCETGADAAPVVPDLIGCFVREEHGWPRELYRRLLTKLLREDRPKLTGTVRGQLVELLGDDIVGGNFPRDHAYTMRGSFFYEQRNSHVLLSLEPDNLVLVSDQLNQLLANFGDPKLAAGKKGANALVILNGEEADAPGLLDMIAGMNDDHRARFMPGLKALLVGGLDVMCDGKSKQTRADPAVLKKVKDKAKAMVDAYEKDHPAVRPYPAKVIDYDGSK